MITSSCFFLVVVLSKFDDWPFRFVRDKFFVSSFFLWYGVFYLRLRPLVTFCQGCWFPTKVTNGGTGRIFVPMLSCKLVATKLTGFFCRFLVSKFFAGFQVSILISGNNQNSTILIWNLFLDCIDVIGSCFKQKKVWFELLFRCGNTLCKTFAVA